MNIVYADVDGNIGYAMSGKLPVRAQRRRHDARRRQCGAGMDGHRSSRARCRACSIRRRA